MFELPSSCNIRPALHFHKNHDLWSVLFTNLLIFYWCLKECKKTMWCDNQVKTWPCHTWLQQGWEEQDLIAGSNDFIKYKLKTKFSRYLDSKNQRTGKMWERTMNWGNLGRGRRANLTGTPGEGRSQDGIPSRNARTQAKCRVEAGAMVETLRAEPGGWLTEAELMVV